MLSQEHAEGLRQRASTSFQFFDNQGIAKKAEAAADDNTQAAQEAEILRAVGCHLSCRRPLEPGALLKRQKLSER